MTPTDIARAIVYSAVALPAFIFVALYLFHLRRLRKTAAGLHLLAFTAVVGYISVDFGAALVLGWWDYSAIRFLVAMSVVAVLVWHRVYLLINGLTIHRWRRWQEQRRVQRDLVR